MGKFDLQAINGDEDTEIVTASQMFHPWRRFFARTLDLSIYSVLWDAFLAFALNVNIMTRGNGGSFLDSCITLLIMLFTEPLLLKLTGTTPGKAVFGIRVVSYNGGKLSYGEGLWRTWRILGKGFGYNIPIYNLVRLWKSYKLCTRNEAQPWDEDIIYTIKDKKWQRTAIYILAFTMTVAATVSISFAQKIPPNSGNLTIAQFVENYNYYANHFGLEFGRWNLDENGEWIETKNENVIWFDFFRNDAKPSIQYTLREGFVHGVVFQFEIENSDVVWVSAYESQMTVATLAFVCAQNEMRLFSGLPSRISDRIAKNLSHSYRFDEAGVVIEWEIETRGYQDIQADVFWANDYSDERYFSLQFSLTK